MRSVLLATCGALLVMAPALVHAQTAGEPRKTAPSSTSDDKLREARAHLQQGQQFYEEEAFEAARAEFLRAYEMTRSYKILYNLALVTAQLNDFAGAYAKYAQYLREGGDEVASSRAAEVRKSMDKLRGRVAQIEVVANAANATITVDDKPVGSAPLAEALMVNPGEHKIGGAAPGRQPAYKHVTLTAGEAVRVSLELPKVEERTIVMTKTRSFNWVAWVPAGVLAAGTIVMGVNVLSASNKLEEMRQAPAEDPDALESQSKKTKSFALVTDILGGATIVATGFALYFTLRSDKPSAEPAGPSGAARSQLGVRIGGRSLALEGTF